jgi:predicted dehydrogenase
MALKIAVMGMRHGHITALIKHAQEHADTDVVAICEEDAATRAGLDANGPPICNDYATMLAEVECDAIAVGDYYSKRGAVALSALAAGKHVIADKPFCTTVAEMEQIAAAARHAKLKLGCMLDMRNCRQFATMRSLFTDGFLGDIHAVSFGGQHPLMPDSRPGWYFEEGKHGGTINDIGIHAIDGLPWLTGLAIARVTAARSWNALAVKAPHMHDCGQMMLELENGAGVLGDVSYLLPDSHGYSHPYYWRFTFWGSKGVLETAYNSDCLTVSMLGESEPRSIALAAGRPAGYLQDFIDDINGVGSAGASDTESVIASSLTTLRIQHAADAGLAHVDL